MTTTRAGTSYWALGHGEWVELRRGVKPPQRGVIKLEKKVTVLVPGLGGKWTLTPARPGEPPVWTFHPSPPTPHTVAHHVNLPRFKGRAGKMIKATTFKTKLGLAAPHAGQVMKLPARLSGVVRDLVRLPFSI